VGGGGVVLAGAEVYAIMAGAFEATGRMTTSRTGQTATLLANGNVLVTGGLTPVTGGGLGALRTAELFVP